MHTIIWILIYFSGYICSYILNRYCFRKIYGKYLISDKGFNLFISLFSWGTFFIVSVLCLINSIYNIDWEKESKW
jgi:hypothetical protein